MSMGFASRSLTYTKTLFDDMLAGAPNKRMHRSRAIEWLIVKPVSGAAPLMRDAGK